MATTPFIIKKVYNASNNYQELTPTTFDDQEEESPSFSMTGYPNVYWQDGLNSIKAYPLDNSTLSITYIPNPITLVDGVTAEADLIIPAPYQDVLMWGCLRYVRIDESDKNVGPEIQIANAMYEQIKGNLMYWLNNSQVRQKLKTVSYMV